ncbi:MAG: PEP-CTERM sorting domain-containing protein [Planctomycetota bacterium]
MTRSQHRTAAVLCGMAVVIAALPAHGLFLDFEDLVLDTQFNTGETITSGGVTLSVVGPGFGPIGVGDDSFVDPPATGQILFFGAGVGLDLSTVLPAQSLSFSFDSTFTDVEIIVNGETSLPDDDLLALDGATIGGAFVSIDSAGGTQPSTQRGTFAVVGDIQSFQITGTEFAFDNLQVVVPEPATGVLIGMAGFALMRRRR